MVFLDQIVHPGYKAGDNSFGHEVIVVLEMEISRAFIYLEIDPRSFRWQQFRHDVDVRSGYGKAQLEFFHQPHQFRVFMPGEPGFIPVIFQIVEFKPALVFLDLAGIDQFVNGFCGPSRVQDHGIFQQLVTAVVENYPQVVQIAAEEFGPCFV